MKKRTTISWIVQFAGKKGGYFLGSILIAVLGVACSFIPYLVIADMVRELIAGNTEKSYYLRLVLLMGVFWILRIVLHSVSTTLSHVATFHVLGGYQKTAYGKTYEDTAWIGIG